YLECARQLLAARDVLYPQFATHNAYTVAAVLELAPPGAAYEFQRLQGMGEALYDAVRAEVPDLPPVRVYAPVGTHEELLPYLVRRLLENGANSSFVHQFRNPQVPVEEVVRDPLSSLAAATLREARLREPRALYGAERANSEGEDFGDPAALERAAELLQARRGNFLSLLVREAGKTLPDALAELREAIDFCRYYAARGRELFGAPQELPGPTGERNELSLHGRGVFVCISP